MSKKKICNNCKAFNDYGPVASHLCGVEGKCTISGKEISGALQECTIPESYKEKFEKSESERIKDVQNLITEYGLADNFEFRKIMEIDTDKKDKQQTYWEKVNNKYFFSKTTTSIALHHIHDLQILDKPDFSGNYVIVKVDNIYLTSTNGYNMINFEFNHILSGTSANRYDNCIEITKERYENIISKLENISKYCTIAFNEIS